MNIKNYVIIVLLPLGSIIFLGCDPKLPLLNPNYVKAYSEPLALGQKVGTLHIMRRDVELKVDGKIIDYEGLSASVQMISGPHEIEWSWGPDIIGLNYHEKGILDVEPGGIYLMEFGQTQTEETRHLRKEIIADYSTWIEDRKTRKVVLGHKPQGGDIRWWESVPPLPKVKD